MQKPKSSTIPLSPGVYLYKDKQGTVLYVGKARVLRKRVLSYFRSNIPPKTFAMLAHAESIEYLTTTTEKEALLLEANLIKRYRPRYNILLRDDKQYVLFRIDQKHPYPRLEIVRQAKKDGAWYFGPLTSALAARDTWKLIHRTFALRRCSDRMLKNRIKTCIYYHIHQCPAPCENLITTTEYQNTIQKVKDLLSGKTESLLEALEAEMLTASDNLEFEKAAIIRDQITSLKQTLEKQAAVIPGGGDMDAIALFSGKQGLALSIIFVRNGIILDGKSFFWQGLTFADAQELLWSFMGQYYANHIPPARIIIPWILEDNLEEIQKEKLEKISEDLPESEDLPAVELTEDAELKEFSFNSYSEEKALLESALREQRGGLVRIVAPQNEIDKQLINIALSNAKEKNLREDQGWLNLQDRLRQSLHLKNNPTRIECVDVSHTNGKQTRVGLVVFENGKANPEAYRIYNMPDSADDYSTLYHWVFRRLESGEPWPDLLLIDGGRGQIQAVSKALDDAKQSGLWQLAGIAKANLDGRPDRRAGNVADKIFLPKRNNSLPIREGSSEMLFLQNIRNTTHRYAIGKHRKARAASAIVSELERVPGIGSALARLIWQHFQTFEDICNATIEDLCSVPKIGKKKAREIYDNLQKFKT